MTHSLHRLGSEHNLLNDFTIYCLPAVGINDIGSGIKRTNFLEIALRNNVVNAGEADIGNIMVYPPRDLYDKIRTRNSNVPDNGKGDGMSPCFCCGSKEDLENIIKEALELDLGLSIMVQGILKDVEDCLLRLGLKPHTVHHSLGIWGKTEKLPEREILEITTMCGHGMTSPALVDKCVNDIIAGTTTPQKAARLLAKPCICGIFNPVRAETLLKELVAKRGNN